MAISGAASYLPTLGLFIPHWHGANAELAPAAPLIVEGKTVADLGALRTELENRRAAVEVARNSQEGARTGIEMLKAALLARLSQFKGKLQTVDVDPVLLLLLPRAYSQGDGLGRVIPALDDMADVWARHDAAGVPLVLRGGYTLAGFTADLALLSAAYKAYGKARNDVKLARGRREETQDAIRPLLVNYRKLIAAEFAERSAIRETLPEYSPPHKGPLPEAVSLSGTYDATENRAEFAWSPVTDGKVKEVQVRASVGPEYEVQDETILATFAPDAPGVWAGTYGLLIPGSASSFKVYTVTAAGRERGSNAVTVTRPA